MKKIMILGAGEYQIPLIEAAKREKYITVVCDYNPKAVGVDKADIFYEVSTLDKEAVLEVAQKESVDGIVGNSDAVMAVVSFVSSIMGLPGNSLNAVNQLMSKKKFRDLQKESNCFAPKYAEVESLKECFDIITSFKFPIIIKPGASSGSRGTTKVNCADEIELIEDAFNECKHYSRNDLVVIEEYIPMVSNYVVEGEIFVNCGQILFDGLFTTIRSKNALTIPMTYCFPAFLEQYQIDKIKEQITRLLNNAGIKHGEYNVELYFTEENEVFVIEINARQGGNKLPDYIDKHCGIDMHRLLVTTSVGEQYYWEEINKSTERQQKYIVHHLLFSRKTGSFKSVIVNESLKKYMLEICVNKKEGDAVAEAKDASYKIGYADFLFESLEQEKEYVARIEELISVEVE